MIHDYEGPLRCWDFEDIGMACFIPRCPKCQRFVRAHTPPEANVEKLVRHAGGLCPKHGMVALEFVGWFSRDEMVASADRSRA